MFPRMLKRSSILEEPVAAGAGGGDGVESRTPKRSALAEAPGGGGEAEVVAGVSEKSISRRFSSLTGFPAAAAATGFSRAICWNSLLR